MAILKGHAVVKNVLDAASLEGVLGLLSQDSAVGLMILDLQLPGLNGCEGIRFLRSKFPGVRIAVMAASTDRDLIIDVLKAGVHGCIPKSLPSDELVAAFRVILAGHIYVPSAVSDLSCSGPKARSFDGKEIRPELTQRQVSVLKLVASGKSNREIAEELGIAEGTVKVHMNAAYRILGVHNRAGALAALEELEAAEAAKEAWLPGMKRTDPHGGGSVFLALFAAFSSIVAFDAA